MLAGQASSGNRLARDRFSEYPAAAKPTGIGATRRGRTLSAKSNRFHYGRARVPRSFGRYSLAPRSFAK